MLDDYDKAAVVALLIKQVRAQDVATRQIAIRDAADVLVKESQALQAAIRESFRVFGFDPKSSTLWDTLRDEISQEEFNRAFRIARPPPPSPPPSGSEAESETKSENEAEGKAEGKAEAKSDTKSESEPETKTETPESERNSDGLGDEKTDDQEGDEETSADETESSTSNDLDRSDTDIEISPSVGASDSKEENIRDLVLGKLSAASGNGAEASAIRKYVEEALSREIHFKTVGMTLWRLSKRNMVHREGKKWFINVPRRVTAGNLENHTETDEKESDISS